MKLLAPSRHLRHIKFSFTYQETSRGVALSRNTTHSLANHITLVLVHIINIHRDVTTQRNTYPYDLPLENLERLKACIPYWVSHSIDSDEGYGGSENETPSGSGEQIGPRTKRIRQSYQKLSILLLDGMTLDDFQLLLEKWCDDSEYVYRPRIDKVRMITTTEIRARFPWVEEHDVRQPGLGSLFGLQQKLRSSHAFYNQKPQYDLAECSTGDTLSICQLRLIFHQPFQDKFSRDPTLCLVRLLVVAQIEESVCSSNDMYWQERTKNLLIRHGCQYYRWKTTENGFIEHAIASLNDITRPVYMVPDFARPFYSEMKDKYFQAGAGASNADLPKNSSLYHEHRFFQNAFMPWTAPVT